jgi:hypothetical protein
MDCLIVLQNKHAALMQFKDASCLRKTGSVVYTLQLACFF